MFFKDFSEKNAVLLESALVSQESYQSLQAEKPLRVISSTTHSLNDLWKALDETWNTPSSSHKDSSLFSGGWIGFLGYEAYSLFPHFKINSHTSDLTPLWWFGYYDNYDVIQQEQTNPDANKQPSSSILHDNARLTQDSSAQNYQNAVKKIQDYLQEGTCYQVNLAQRFSVPYQGDAYSLYRKLCQKSPMPYAAFLNLGDIQILSASPECFFKIENNKIITKPIKGTRARSANSAEDQQLKNDLQTHLKDKAELLMITDLERNDLGKICKPGSIQTSTISKVETYTHLHHQLSEIEGELQDGLPISKVLLSLFPGGSITGAPKQKAMEIIHTLELVPRNVYCGAIGYVSHGQKAQFNIAIRTMILKNQKAYFYSGAGIVMDSDPKREFEETLLKARGMLDALT